MGTVNLSWHSWQFFCDFDTIHICQDNICSVVPKYSCVQIFDRWTFFICFCNSFEFIILCQSSDPIKWLFGPALAFMLIILVLRRIIFSLYLSWQVKHGAAALSSVILWGCTTSRKITFLVFTAEIGWWFLWKSMFFLLCVFLQVKYALWLILTKISFFLLSFMHLL